MQIYNKSIFCEKTSHKEENKTNMQQLTTS